MECLILSRIWRHCGGSADGSCSPSPSGGAEESAVVAPSDCVASALWFDSASAGGDVERLRFWALGLGGAAAGCCSVVDGEEDDGGSFVYVR